MAYSLYNTAEEVPPTMAQFTASKDFKDYAIGSDGTTAFAVCTVELILSQYNRDTLGPIFDKVYTVNSAITSFSGMDAITGNAGAALTFDIYLPAPTYQEEKDEISLDASVTENRFMVDLEVFGANLQGAVEYKVDFKVSPEFHIPDILAMKFKFNLPPSIIPSGAVVYQFVQWNPANDFSGWKEANACVYGLASGNALKSYSGPESLKGDS